MQLPNDQLKLSDLSVFLHDGRVGLFKIHLRNNLFLSHAEEGNLNLLTYSLVHLLWFNFHILLEVSLQLVDLILAFLGAQAIFARIYDRVLIVHLNMRLC